MVTLDGKDNITKLKAEAATKFSIADPATIKLIYRGKLLVDEKTLEEYDIKDDSIIIVMKVNNTAPEKSQDELDYEKHKAVTS